MATLEIGAGRGALTRHLAAAAPAKAQVLAVEVDYDLIPGLESLSAELPCVRPVQSDVLDIDLPGLLAGHGIESPVRVVGNVPYNITTPILTWLLSQSTCWDRAVVMTQKEVAERLATRPGAPGCGSISAFMHYHATVARLFDVGVGAFTPRPRVRSSVIEITPRDTPAVDVADEDLLFTVTRQAFQQRRKMLRGALRALGADAPRAVEDAGIDPTRRGETLSLEEFAAVANCLHDARAVT
jgi:16S rRNA (adenine1518-N6/adenine1519-N6)-dimethyltransferase